MCKCVCVSPRVCVCVRQTTIVKEDPSFPIRGKNIVFSLVVVVEKYLHQKQTLIDLQLPVSIIFENLHIYR